MTMELRPEDREWIKELREKDILREEMPEQLPQDNGVILVTCSDGDQIDEVFDHMRDFAKTAGQKPRIHTISNHGGAMLTSPLCPIYRKFQVYKCK